MADETQPPNAEAVRLREGGMRWFKVTLRIPDAPEPDLAAPSPVGPDLSDNGRDHLWQMLKEKLLDSPDILAHLPGLLVKKSVQRVLAGLRFDAATANEIEALGDLSPAALQAIRNVLLEHAPLARILSKHVYYRHIKG